MGKKLCVVDGPLAAIDNLARNEACFEAVRSGQYGEIVRVYSFRQPGVILSKYQHRDDVREYAWQNQEVTRRKTGGGAVYVDEHTLGYSVFGRIEGVVGSVSNPIDIPYQRMRFAVMETLRSFGLNPKEEKHWGVRLDDGVVAGHAQRFDNGVYEVHGLLRLKRWEMEKVASAIRLRKRAEKQGLVCLIVDGKGYDLQRNVLENYQSMRVVRDEYAELEGVPSLEEKNVDRAQLVERLVNYLSGGEQGLLPKELLAKAREIEANYANPAFVRGSDSLKKHLGHCFVDLE